MHHRQRPLPAICVQIALMARLLLPPGGAAGHCCTWPLIHYSPVPFLSIYGSNYTIMALKIAAIIALLLKTALVIYRLELCSESVAGRGVRCGRVWESRPPAACLSLQHALPTPSH